MKPFHSVRNLFSARRTRTSTNYRPAFESLEDRLTPSTTPGVDFYSATLSSSTFITDTAYRDVGLSKTFVSDGKPVDLSSTLQITNFGSGQDTYYFRYMLDGLPLASSERYVGLASTYYGQVRLDNVVSNLSAGTHTLSIQGHTSAGNQVRIDSGSLLNIVQSHPIPGSGPSVTVYSTPSTSSVFLTETSYRDTGLTQSFTTDGSNPVKVRATVQATDMNGSTGDSYFFRVLVDGAAVNIPEGYATVTAGSYREITLEGILPSLAAGPHTLSLQAHTSAGTQLRIDSGTTLTVEQFHTVPGVGSAVTVNSAILPSSLRMSDTLYRNVGLSTSFTSDGRPARMESLLQITNFGSIADSYFFRFTLDGAVLPGFEAYTTLGAGNYIQVHLDQLVTGLAAGNHTLAVQAKTSNATDLRIDGTAASVSVTQFRSFPVPDSPPSQPAVTMALSPMPQVLSVVGPRKARLQKTLSFLPALNTAAADYSWRVMRGSKQVATGSGASFRFRPTMAGSYSVLLTVTDQFGRTSNQFGVNVAVTR